MPKTSAGTHHPLSQAPLDELAAELARRKGDLPKLLNRRDKLRAELEEVEAQVAMLESLDGRPSSGGSGPSNRSPQARNAGTPKKVAGSRRGRGGGPTLRQKIAEILGSDPMRPVEIASTLVDRGLHHGSKSLQIQVSTTLAKFDEFRKVARGLWVHNPDQDHK